MDNIDPITKEIQQINLKTYKTFAKICDENNLRYFAVSGTAIGVHFWQGFIPWDDDMDIAMPFEDFEKFRKSICKQLPKEYSFIEFPELGGKIYNKNTTLIEAPYAYLPDHYYGAFIDIVPLIGLPDNFKERANFISQIKRYIVEAGAVDRAPELAIFTGQTVQTIKKTRKELANAFPFGTTKYCTDFSCIKCPTYLTSGFLQPKSMKFEDTTIPTTSELSHDLNIAYDNLTKNIPANERQLLHHDFYAFCNLENPCQKYAKEYQKIKLPDWFKEISYKDHLFGISSAREAGLYKNRCKELESSLDQAYTEIELLRSSASYKIGNTIIKPFSKLKSIFTKKS